MCYLEQREFMQICYWKLYALMCLDWLISCIIFKLEIVWSNDQWIIILGHTQFLLAGLFTYSLGFLPPTFSKEAILSSGLKGSLFEMSLYLDVN